MKIKRMIPIILGIAATGGLLYFLLKPKPEVTTPILVTPTPPPEVPTPPPPAPPTPPPEVPPEAPTPPPPAPPEVLSVEAELALEAV